MVNATPRPLYPRERADTRCTGEWLGLRAGLEVRKICSHTRTESPFRPAHNESLYRPTWFIMFSQNLKFTTLLFGAELHCLLEVNRRATRFVRIIYALASSKFHTWQPRGVDIFEIRRQACFTQLIFSEIALYLPELYPYPCVHRFFITLSYRISFRFLAEMFRQVSWVVNVARKKCFFRLSCQLTSLVHSGSINKNYFLRMNLKNDFSFTK